MLSYWEQHGYEISWVTLTSSEESDDADRLAYNQRRLRQTIERARLAYDADGNAHRLDHIRELESLVIRTSEGPEGKGVLHLFWAWKPPAGSHSRSLFIPHKWLSEQWGRIHGPHDEHSEEEIQPLHVWITKTGEVDYHSRESLAGYCVSQYLGEHGEALENVSWSWERTLGGSVTEAWDTVKAMTGSLERAKEVWHRVMGGEEVSLSSQSEHVDYGKVVKPPPDLAVIESRPISITPPDGWSPQGPHQGTMRTDRAAIPEYDPDYGYCPVCGERGTVVRFEDAEDDRVSFRCEARAVPGGAVRCGATLAAVGEGGQQVERTPVPARWRQRQTRLREWEQGPASVIGRPEWRARLESAGPSPESSGHGVWVPGDD
ncbi:hypothetical protein J2754_003292 [Halarchaeum solikamskense]|uniref:hypothetical protein n=1 Tax=Halarchaeum nitratireducens TaxID=489913 RepID=UPI001B3AB70F|nr:hypothetical protein [Halarchaeum solikamskense]MBP2252929.1 hypothetical protein [Halarchaeum solikamskense]